MTKQEKLLERTVEAYCKWNGWEYVPGNEDTDMAYRDVNFFLSYLHSQGVVIKVEKEDVEVKIEKIEVLGTKMNVIIPDSFVAVAPLIEGGKEMKETGFRPDNWDARKLAKEVVRSWYTTDTEVSIVSFVEAGADAILKSPQIAVVDRDAELPKNPRHDWSYYRGENYRGYEEAQKDMVNAHYVKEVTM